MKNFLLFAGLLFICTAQAQVGIGTTSPEASSILDITSTTKGLLIPRMTQSDRTAIASPVAGLMVYQTDAPAGFYYHNGTTWNTVGGSTATLHFNGTVSSSVPFAGGSISVVNYNSAVTNVGTQMNTANGSFTAAATGVYNISASGHFSGGGARFLIIRVNSIDVFTGSSGVGNAAFPASYGTTASTASVSAMYPLTAGDIVQIVLVNNSTATSNYPTGATRLTIVKM